MEIQPSLGSALAMGSLIIGLKIRMRKESLLL